MGSRKKILEIGNLRDIFRPESDKSDISEKLITIARDEVVGFVSKPARQQLHD